MHLIYLDESGDTQSNRTIYSALAVPVETWRANFNRIREYRRDLRAQYGIFIYKEWHAWKFVSGRGRISDRVLNKTIRADIFRKTLKLATQLDGVRLFNASFPLRDNLKCVEWLLTRIDRTLLSWKSYGLLVPDAGHEHEFRRLVRRMAVFNPIPSMQGQWPEGTPSRNITTDRIVEDPFFKPSEQSYFIQLVDFAAYALLRHDYPIPSKSRYGLNTAFRILEPILEKSVRPRHQFGVIRPED